MKVNYQYKALPTTQQKLTLNEWRRIGQYWYNRQVGDRLNWWENNRCHVLPVGISQSDYLSNVKLFKDRQSIEKQIAKEVDPRKLIKLQKRLTKLLSQEFLTAEKVEYCSLTSQPILAEPKEQPDFFSQKKELPILKQDYVTVGWSHEQLDFSKPPAWTMQDICKRAKLAFDRFLIGDKDGKRSGKPRFKSEISFKTLNFCDPSIADCIMHSDAKYAWVKVPKIDEWLMIRLHRPIPDGFVVKQFMLNYKADGLSVTFTLEDESVPVFTPVPVEATWENSMGIDAVLQDDVFLATSEPECFKLPSVKSFRKNQAKLAKVSNRKSSKKRGSRRRRKLAKRESRMHQRIARARKDHHFKTAHKLVRTGAKVFFPEKLNLKGLTKRNKAKQDDDGKFLPNGQSSKSGLNKSWLDAGFGQFFIILEYIAGKAGSRVEKQTPNYTSQLLSYRDEFIFTELDIREYWDPVENLWVDRDIDSAINLKRVGLDVFPTIKRRRGKATVISSITDSTSKEALSVLRAAQGQRSPL